MPDAALAPRLDDASLREIVAHLLERYHRPLDVELPRLQRLLDKVVTVHGLADPERFAAMARTYAAIRNEIEPHMMREEHVLFPWILSGHGASADGAMAVMRADHDLVLGLLDTMRDLCAGYVAGEHACGTWRALWDGLAALDRDTREHIRIENDLLFLRALAS